MKFGMRNARTAFNRQILESVQIQSRRKRHTMRYSKSEYSHCGLPRLMAKFGEESFDNMEKEKKEEKVAEIEIETKKRNLKIK